LFSSVLQIKQDVVKIHLIGMGSGFFPMDPGFLERMEPDYFTGAEVVMALSI
jgi:hypothetical protein